MAKLQKLTKEQRLKVYRKAFNMFKKHVDHVIEHGESKVRGMCDFINDARRNCDYGYRTLNKTNFPEYFSFKPKTGWKEDGRYWLTRRVKNGGHTKRLRILGLLAEGKSKFEV